MIELEYEILELANLVPLTISRGVRARSRALWVTVTADGVEGWGEAGEFGLGGVEQRLADLEAGVVAARDIIRDMFPLDRDAIEGRLRGQGVPSAVISAVDQALWDWIGKKAGLPVWWLWGLDLAKSPPTSVTVGLGSPGQARERVRQWMELGDIRVFKLKVGSPSGIDADKANVDAVRAEMPAGALLGIDANGGWSLEGARDMTRWLEDKGVSYIEQPLARGRESELRPLRERSPLPFIVDESFFVSRDLPALLAAGGVDGINIKLMKCGGLSEAIRIIHTARAHRLTVMIGCYYHTALGNTAAATLGPLADYLDLDSHLNLAEDPFRGAIFVEGRILPPAAPGFGVTLR